MRKNPTRFIPQTGKVFEENIQIIIISLYYAFMGRISVGVENKQLNYILKINMFCFTFIKKYFVVFFI